MEEKYYSIVIGCFTKKRVIRLAKAISEFNQNFEYNHLRIADAESFNCAIGVRLEDFQKNGGNTE